MVTLLSLGLAAVTGAALVSATLRARAEQRRVRRQSRPLHELRGALAALRLGVVLLERATAAPSTSVGRKGTIEALQLQLNRAEIAVSELDACRTEAKGMDSARRERFELGTVVPDRARMWAGLAPAYDATVRVDWRGGSAPVLGDRACLIRALDNLISNALEHGGGRVWIEGERLSRHVRITVRDQGPGLNGPVTEAEESHWSTPRGHGLAIAREAILAHGGSLVARGGLLGSRLVVQLPLADPTATTDRLRQGRVPAAEAGSRGRGAQAPGVPISAA